MPTHFRVIVALLIALISATGCGKATPTPVSFQPVNTPVRLVATPVPLSMTAVPSTMKVVQPTATAMPPVAAALPVAGIAPSLDSSVGGMIAFDSDREGNTGIYAMAVLDAPPGTDGGAVRCLTNMPADHAAWSPDGTQIAFTSNQDENADVYIMDVTEALQDTGSGQPRRMTSYDAYDGAPAWSPNGEQIAFDSDRDGNYEIYVLDVPEGLDAGNGKPRRLTNNAADDFWAAWSPDGTQIAFTSDRDGSFDIYLLDVANVLQGTGSGEPGRLTTNDAADAHPTWSPDGTRIAFYSTRDGNAEIYIMNADGSGQWRLTYNAYDDWHPAWSPDGNQIAFVSYHNDDGKSDVEIYAMDVTLGSEADGNIPKRLTHSPAHDDNPAWAPGSSFVVASLLNPQTNQAEIPGTTVAQEENLHILGGHTPNVAGLTFLPDGIHMASLTGDFSLKLWDVATGQEVRKLIEHGGRVYNVAFSLDGSLMATDSADNTIKLWDVQSGQEIGILSGHETLLLSLAFSPDGTLLASSGDDNTIKLWDVASGQEVNTLYGHITPVTALAFSPDGRLLASGGARFSTVIKLWDISSGKEFRVLTGHTDNVNRLLFSPDGTLLASASPDRTVRLWDLKTGQEVHTFTEQKGGVYGLAFSPDSALLALSGDNGTIRLWDVKEERELCILSGHSDYVRSIAFSPDGAFLASGGLDGTVILRSTPRGEPSSSRPVSSEPLPAPAASLANEQTSSLPTAANGVLAFSSYREGESQLFTMNADGSDVTRLTMTRLRDTRPAWSPDGSRIAYVRRLSFSNHEIFVTNADGSGQATRITYNPDSVESEPTWSPDGSRIAFISNRNLDPNTFAARFNIFVMNADGSEQTLLTPIGGGNSSPDWSPDGQRIAFDSTRDGNYEIYVINVDGSHPVNLTEHPANDTSPAWSPDGNKIAFVSDRDGNQEIYVMSADGSNQTRLTDRSGFDKGPAWSPDGQYILFYARSEGFNTEIYRMRADGSEQIRLTDHANFDGFPAWQPLPLAATTPITETAHAPLSATDLASRLEGLSLDEFFEASWQELMLRDPEWVLVDGLAEACGLEGAELTNISDAYIRETQQMYITVLELLRRYNRDELAPEQQISYDVYEWFLDDQVRQQEFMYYDYPITHFTTGIQNQLIQFFTDLHPVASRQDAEDYVMRLSQVDDKFEGLIEGLRLREKAGVILPKFIFPWLMGDIRRIAHSQPQLTPFYTAFKEKLNSLDDLSPEDRQALLQSAEKAIEESVIPAFAALAETLQDLESVAPTDEGVWQFPNGDAYYDYTLRHHTTTNMTAEEIHELGLQELERIHAEMRAIFDELGYPQDESIPELYARVARESDYVSGSNVAETYEAIIEEAEQNLDAAFDIRPKADVVVIAGPLGDYYQTASLDGSRPGAFYARIDGGGKALYDMPTLTYHETVPGHHFQIAIAQESDLPLFRNVILFTGYAEGWALYAEQLAYELGWYQDDPYGNLGRLRAQAFRAARLVVDTGIHAKGWTFDQAHDFMVQNVGRDPGYLEFEVSRYITWPGQATAYMVGMLKIMELRQRAMDQLRDEFDLKEFHRVVLSNGSMPLEVLERVVDDYIEAERNQ